MKIIASRKEEFEQLFKFNEDNLKFTKEANVVLSNGMFGGVNMITITEDLSFAKKLQIPFNQIYNFFIDDIGDGYSKLTIYGVVNDIEVVYTISKINIKDLDVRSVYRK